MARYAGPRLKPLMYLGVMLPLWSSYLVRVYSWKLILAKEGIVTWIFAKLHLLWLLDWILSIPVIGGPSLSTAYLGTFIVFVYIWLPYMILPIEAAIERVPRSVIEASADLGAHPRSTFRHVVLPLAIPGVVAGSIFTFSLTLGDYIVPSLVSNTKFIGNVINDNSSIGSEPLAAAYALVPVLVMVIYLLIARRMGAFESL
jgi:putative spermidine/putrescine transport system permease protein